MPIKLQNEVDEINDWSLQELLQQLLRAEERVAEWERHSTQLQAGPKKESVGN